MKYNIENLLFNKLSCIQKEVVQNKRNKQMLLEVIRRKFGIQENIHA